VRWHVDLVMIKIGVFEGFGDFGDGRRVVKGGVVDEVAFGDGFGGGFEVG
jgi:hypothetical protein